MRGRAVRRHHEHRLKVKVRDYYAAYARRNARALGKLAQTRAPCSCAMCGNPRRWGELSLAERRRDAAIKST